MKFNPFTKVNCSRGAPMGRHGHSPGQYDGVSKLYARHCGGDGYYDRGGAYWGHSNVWAVWARGGVFCAYVEARSEESALAKVRSEKEPLAKVREIYRGPSGSTVEII